MNSIYDVLNGPLTGDQLMEDPGSIYAAMGEEYEDPRTLSRRIQEALGAKEPNQAGFAGDILSKRFKPSLDDVSRAAIETLMGGKPVSGQNVADTRLSSDLERLQAIAKTQYYSEGKSTGSSVFSQTMQAINSDPDLAGLPMIEKIRLAQNKLGANLTLGTDGVQAMTGAPQALGNLKFGEKSGEQRAVLDYAGDIEIEKQRSQNLGEQELVAGKKSMAANDVISIAREAEPYLDQASGSLLGAGMAIGKRSFGRSDLQTQADTALEVLGGRLVSAMPRMEGPQSNYDVQLYREMAGRIADKTVPAGDKRKALEILVELNQKYANTAPSSQVNEAVDWREYFK